MAGNDDVAFEIRFLEKLQRLLREGDFTATYKFAVLIGLAELAIERQGSVSTREQTLHVTTRDLAEKVAELYWQHTRPVETVRGDSVVVLRQNTGPRPARIAVGAIELREQVSRYRADPPTLASLKTVDPAVYESFLKKVERSLIEMPLPRLQRIDRFEDRFIYDISWSVEQTDTRSPRRKAFMKGVEDYLAGGSRAFDSEIRLRPRVPRTLARFHGLIRDMVEARWIRMIERLNPEVHAGPDLHERLFGPKRVNLDAVREALRDLQEGRCFYCSDRAVRTAVDHFIPWSAFPNDRIENLVVSHPRCNADKSACLASTDHVRKWVVRFTPGAVALVQLQEAAVELGWRHEPKTSLAIARHVYARYPSGTPLWRADRKFADWSRSDVLAEIDRALRWFGPQE